MDPAPEESGRDAKRKKKTGRAYGGRSIGQKELLTVYGGTGMDPRSRVRRKVSNYAMKKCKRKKESSSSSTRDSSDEDSSSATEEAVDAMQDYSRIRLLHRHGPGLLTTMGLQRMQGVLTEVEGIWGKDTSSLLPVALRYVRSQLGGKLAGAALKEAVTVAGSLDLLVQGRIAEGCDYLIQRLKSLEKISQGVSWQTTERLELAPGHQTQISSHAEMAAAWKEAELDQDQRGGAPGNANKGSQGKGGKKGKADEKGKGKRKEPPPKGGGNQGA